MDEAEAEADDALLTRLFDAVEAKSGLFLTFEDLDRVTDIILMLEKDLTYALIANQSLARALADPDGVTIN